jgi:hypothetical protein
LRPKALYRLLSHTKALLFRREAAFLGTADWHFFALEKMMVCSVEEMMDLQKELVTDLEFCYHEL